MYIEQSAHSSGSVLGWPAVCARLYSYCCLSELDLCKCCVERYVGLQKVLSYVTDLHTTNGAYFAWFYMCI